MKEIIPLDPEEEEEKKDEVGQLVSPLNGNHHNTNGASNGVSNGSGHCSDAEQRHQDNKTNGRPQKIHRISTMTETMCRLKNMSNAYEMIDTLHIKAEKSQCSSKRCLGSIVNPISDSSAVDDIAPGELRSKSQVLHQAKEFITTYYKSLNKSLDDEELENRLRDISEQIKSTGTYEMYAAELAYGARLAWRNASRCIGRIQWKKLQFFDCRHCRTPRDMFECILQHLKFATNKGKIRSTISVFPQKTEHFQEFRIWNSQLIRYAGYKQPDGSVIGDPASVQITNIAQKMGWKGAGTPFDVLPLILQASGTDPEFFDIPPEYILEVDITHPSYPQIDSMGLKWYGVPCVSDVALDCGGLQFTAAPFNGWYMATEISARNFTDSNRYNLLKPIASKLGLDVTNNTTLWKDKITLELTTAVLHSYTKAGVTIVDHHTASESFMKHMKDEEKSRGGCPADWVWIVPPISGSITPVFHQEMLNYKLLPAFYYQELPWKYLHVEKSSSKIKRRFRDIVKAVKFTSSLFGGVLARRYKVTILFATETGKSQAFASRLNDLFLHGFDAKCICMEDYKIGDMENEQCMLLVASTFGNGEAPDNGQKFLKDLCKLIRPDSDSTPRHSSLGGLDSPMNTIPEHTKYSNVRYSVFGLGSRAYPKFCEFGHMLDCIFGNLGFEQIFPMGEGDELCAQENSFQEWSQGCFKAACDYFGVTDVKINPDKMMSSNNNWKDATVRIKKANNKETFQSLHDDLCKLHNKELRTYTVISVENLQSKQSDRVTNLVRLGTTNREEMNYEPGDHLYILPHNNIDHVAELLRRVRCNDVHADDLINIHQMNEKRSWELLETIPMPTTLSRIFECFLDISSPPSTKLLKYFSEQAEDDEDKRELLQLANNSEVYDDWKVQENPTLLEVLQRFPSVDVDVLMLIQQLPFLKPRPYSISSSQKLYPCEVHVTVALVSYQINSGATHHGVCSSYLNRLEPGSSVHCFIKSAHSFRLPDDKKAPILMVGPGTGIAPFRSFWQEFMFERQSGDPLQQRSGNTILYFGCRNPGIDDIYKEELEETQTCHAISKVYTAYSRIERKPKVYVQDLITQNHKEVCEILMDARAHLYVCGDVTMASDVCRALMSVLMRYQAFSESEAEGFITDMKEQGRYHEDIFGVTLKVKEVTHRVRSAVKRRASMNQKNRRSMILPGRNNLKHPLRRMMSC